MALLGACKSKEEPAPPTPGLKPKGLTTSHRTFTSEEYAVMAAAAERILPRDEDPGALDAHVPEYIDRILTTPVLRPMKEEFLSGTAALDRRCKRMFKTGFAQASAAQQDEVLTLFKESPRGTGEAHYYELLLVLTLEGLLGDPSYGGNKDYLGWKLAGFSLVGELAAPPPPGYDGVEHLHSSKGPH